MMADEENKTISLSEFANRALEGEEFKQELADGRFLTCRVFTPTQADALAIQGIMAEDHANRRRR